MTKNDHRTRDNGDPTTTFGEPSTAVSDAPHQERKVRQKAPSLPPTPRGLGSSVEAHPGREIVARARLQARIQREAITAPRQKPIEKQVGIEVDFQDPKWVEAEVDRRMEELKSYSHPRTTEYLTAFGPHPDCRTKRPEDCNDVIELKALRTLPWVQSLEEKLGDRDDKLGAPSERKLAVASFVVAGLTGSPKALKGIHKALSGSNALLDDSLGHPAGDGTHCRAYNSVTVSLGRQLNHHDPEYLMELNGEFLRMRREELGPEYGKRVVLDGMKWETHLLQSKGYSHIESQLLKRGFTRAEFGYHGPGEGWRGFTLLALRDLHSLDLMGWLLAPANERENGFVETLFLRTLQHFPEWRPEVLVADSEYDVKQLYSNLMERFGTHLICPLRDTLGAEYKLGKEQGVPECAGKTQGKPHGLMQRMRDREFPLQETRQQLGLKPAQRAPIDRARTEWKCRECGVGDVTYFKTNPRIFGYHPRRGDHKLVGQREALQVLRNVAESTNASLQYRGFGLKGQSRAKWVSTDQQAEWLAGTGLFAMNLRQLIHGEDGPYEVALRDVRARELIKPERSSRGALSLVHGGAGHAVGPAAAVSAAA